MRVDTQRKPLGFQELTLPKYRYVSICVASLTRSQNVIPHSLVFETTGILEQPSNTSLLQSIFWLASVTLSNAQKKPPRRVAKVRIMKKVHLSFLYISNDLLLGKLNFLRLVSTSESGTQGLRDL